MLAPFGDRVVLVEVATEMPVEGPVDLTLFDTFGTVHSEGQDIDAILSSDAAGKVAVYSWNLHPQLIDDALSKGCSGYVSKGLDGKDLVEVLERIHGGEVVVSTEAEGADGRPVTAENTDVTWPGKDEGLSPRESEVIAMIVQGCTNNDIAERSYLSINSVKSYIRSAYRKMGVERRSQAVRWGMENGLLPAKNRLKFN
ncbi:DNA-binding response regulator [Tessaracoccus antarcticus]|uniref:DNA-binding response regulator n=2 Tax=Tessaracoccus antarcticus TaxID=2479848 RepID=A0A3M0G663_9ACTN|nr:DNA-binding response regulator [Tessaracoccus antarcticus]